MPDNYYATFEAERYHEIKSKLLNYRLDNFIREAEKREGPGKGLIFPFVRGLRFSALLIYAIREALSGTELETHWGQIVGDDGLALSGECDIIIHRKGHIKKWNGSDHGNDVMDFRFIGMREAIAVISCKSYLTKAGVEADYCANLLQYVRRVWLFAECCGPESVDLIRKEALAVGYENFWYMYIWNRGKENIEEDLKLWSNFIATVKTLKV